MLIALHKNARTTPAVRAEIAASDEPASILAQRFGITEQTVYKWKKRDVFADRSHTAHRLQTVLTPAQETVVVHLRRTLLLPLDDLLAVTREFICPHVSRSGLDRCLRRHGAGNLNALKPQEPAVAHKAFKSYEPGYVHMDVKYLPQMQDESSRRYLFVAIDRATRWVFVQLKSNKTAASAQAFLKALHKACPIRINKLLTDNGKEFTDRLFASKEREPSGNHEFDQLCRELGIEHRLTKPRTPRTNGMVERFNGRIADVLKTHRFNSREDMEETLLRYVALYNHQLPQSALKSSTPMQAMKDWYQTHPHLFHKRPYDRTGCDTYVTDNILKSLKDIILLSGLDPEHFADRWESNTRAIKTWLGTGDLRKVILEIYNPATDKLVTRWDIDIVYGWSDGDGSFWTDTEQLKYAIKKAGLLPSQAKYKLMLDTKPGRPDVEGWSKGSYRSTDGMVKQSLGSTVEHSGLAGQAGYWRQR
ncbi:IS481 family transposase [Pseudomonas aeruginosa]|nr:IS481 family transposase [Pseudomonas aeruginosa]MBG4656149.1 IS481 family transposase [Pseudomonas aeruginosa]MBG4939036.1 IS481 family transposase [Pseudomonas aeruginosa]MBG5762929.1 IS481 family transposase [Pseudomonas aeruginosa]MBG6693341.1 IS481 family transposase [Pseudomonas aeruginosa]